MSTTVLPDMTVEERVSTHGHGVPEPTHDFLAEISDAMILNDDAKVRGWADSTLTTLIKHIPQIPDLTAGEIKTAIREVAEFRSWKEVTEFVQTDECPDFYMKLKYYVTKAGIPTKEDLGFINGTGIGYYGQYLAELDVTLQNAFSAKWFYKMERPLVVAANSGLPLTDIANWIHPGHWAYPAGHGTKFLTAVRVLRDQYVLTPEQDRKILITACVLSHGRSGSLIHYPSDNLASWDMVFDRYVAPLV